MKLHFKTTMPGILKEEIIHFIEKGNAKTWEVYINGKTKYLLHTGQWKDKGVLRLIEDDYNDVLIINILKFKNVDQKLEEFQGYYLGRFCEFMFNNFWSKFTSIEKHD